MLDTREDDAVQLANNEVAKLVSTICKRIPPLWDLNNYVAVNPFMGFASQPLTGAARVIQGGLGAQLLPPIRFYQERWKNGAFQTADLTRSARRAGFDSKNLEEILAGRSPGPSRIAGTVLSCAERIDLERGSDWNAMLCRSITRWCAVYASNGGTHWQLPALDHGPFSAWREAAAVDRTLEIAGLRGWRRWVSQLPSEPVAAIGMMLSRLKLHGVKNEEYLYSLLRDVYGWASFFRRSSWENGTDETGAIAELLAIRACADAAVAELVAFNMPVAPAVKSSSVEEESVRVVFQDAIEDGYVNSLFRRIKAPPGLSPPVRPELQAAFCIDVRSEPLRRHLETQSESIETRGFAGFFGIALDWRVNGLPSARCPVLLKPAVALRSSNPPKAAVLLTATKYVQAAPSAAFSFVETLGIAYGLLMGRDTFAVKADTVSPDAVNAFTLDPTVEELGVAPEARVDMAHGILTNMRLRTRFARLVLLCGHEGHSANNPHSAGLDCGACGGHGGSINARVAAAILNEPFVRNGLSKRGIEVPADTWFLPAVHDTSVDEVSLLDTQCVPAGHAKDIEQLRKWLAAAGEHTRTERSTMLGLAPLSAGKLKDQLSHRARDWSEVRPEWALARNAAFIAARRERTRGVDLDGRAFLHDYDCFGDNENAILALILTAPMVVASWINLQYFASTVDNRFFGCGDKALHNRVGSLGVVLGNGGDLRTGLPLQSVQSPDGTWYHEPLRLQVIVEAETDRIDLVLSAHRGVRDLVDNGWVRMFALHPATNDIFRRMAGGHWEVCHASETALAHSCSYGN